MGTSQEVMQLKYMALRLLAWEKPKITVREACDRLKSDFGFKTGMDNRWASKVIKEVRLEQGGRETLIGHMRGRGYNNGNGPVQERRRTIHLDAEATSC